MSINLLVRTISMKHGYNSEAGNRFHKLESGQAKLAPGKRYFE